MTWQLRRAARARTFLMVLAMAVLVTAMAIAGTRTALSQSSPGLYPKEEAYKAIPIPDRTILTPTDTPATSQAVTWRTDLSVVTPQAQIAPTAGGPAFKANATTVIAESSEPVVATLGAPAAFHTVRFDGLTPDTDYLYRVGDGINWSEWFGFTTATDGPSPFSFIYYGDAQNDVREHVSRVFRRAFADRPATELIVHAGDLVDIANMDAQWGEWFHAGGWINGMVNSIGTPGNHEYLGPLLSPYWRPQFDWPDNGPTGTPTADALAGTVYYVDYQGVRFISLNSNTGAGPEGAAAWLETQAEWLDGVLSDNPNRWTVVTFHHPVFANSPSRDNKPLRDAWLPVLTKHNVDLVLQGHDHSYARGNLASGLSAEYDGTVFVVSVSGPKMYDQSDSNWTTNGAEQRKPIKNTQLYQLVDVDAGELRYEARTATGEYHDGFRILKAEDGSKKVVEDAAEPENEAAE
jgi:hypothetical protein